MQAFAVQTLGARPALLDLPIPGDDGDFRIRVTYAGVNPIDYKSVGILNEQSTFPFVLGIDFAGVLLGVPAEGDHGLKAGDRVFGMARTHGSYASHTAITPGKPREPLALIPEGVADEQAAALPVAGVAALGALELLDLAPGQTLTVMGAAGGVGGYAVQAAHARGIRVIGTGYRDKAEAKRLGAETVFDAKAVDVFEAIADAYPEGVDAVLDLVNGKDKIGQNTGILKPNGRLATTLYAADEAWFTQRSITAYNIGKTANPMSSPAGLATLARLVADGVLTPRIGSVVELTGVANMLDDLRNGGLHGKAVIRI